MEETTSHPRRFNGEDLRNSLAKGTQLLHKYRDAINALNVFPVPDGDTGTNMLLTMQSVNVRTRDLELESLSSVAREAASGALMGARGNSGVILSQFLGGFAQAIVNTDACDGKTLSEALICGSTAAYSAVSNPVEGTMLTVIRELSNAADKEASREDYDNVINVLAAALQGARIALKKTPSQLRVLAEARVVDAGGQGIVMIMEGFLAALKGEKISHLEVEISAPSGNDLLEPVGINQASQKAFNKEHYGYCTEFIIENARMNVEEVRRKLEGMGNSTVVVGNSSLIKVHIHTFNPSDIINYGATVGTTSQVKVDDIDQQHQRFMAFHGTSSSAPELGIVAVTCGEGFAKLFEELGCHALVSCDRTMNPSVEELLDAADSTEAQEVVILPNNSNVILAARQAVSISSKSLHCIPTASMPQGIASLLAYSPDIPLKRTMEAMQLAKGNVKTLEITTAARNASISGTPVLQDQIIGLLEGSLMAIGDSAFDVLEKSLVGANLDAGALLTLYWGSNTCEADAQADAKQLRASLTSHEVELVYGGQPSNYYIASIE